MADAVLQADIAEFLFREARLLDARRWSEWLDLYGEDAVFWAPAFTMRGDYTTDPERELNLIYIVGKSGLAARIFRLETGASLASTPTPRTVHLVTGVMVDAADAQEVRVAASWQVASFDETRDRQTRNGSYAYRLRRTDKGFLIVEKKIFVLEQVIDGYFDVYSI
jgi:3-phenylpropionate/cinnamic acid dioxygenase small subunit